MSAMAMGGCGSLWSALAGVRDHRRGAGRRYPLAGLLLIAVAALLAGRRDQLGIVRWGRGLSVSALASLGLTRGRVPAPSVWCELFQGLDVASLEAALGAWVRGGGAPGHIAIDGKRLRGSATATAPGVHLLAAFSDALGGVIGQLQLAPDSNEITAALELLKALSSDTKVRGLRRRICSRVCSGTAQSGHSLVRSRGPFSCPDRDQTGRRAQVRSMMPRSGTGPAGTQRRGRRRARCHAGRFGSGSAAGCLPAQARGSFSASSR